MEWSGQPGGLGEAPHGLCPHPAPPFGALTPPHAVPSSPTPPVPGRGESQSPSQPCTRHPKAQQSSPLRSLQLRAEPFLGCSVPPAPVPVTPRTPRTSAAEAKGEEGQEGQQDEGLHGASLHGRCARCSPWSLCGFIGWRDHHQGGAPRPRQGYFQHIRWGREPPAQAAIVV